MANVTINYSKKGDVHTLDTGPGVLGKMVVDYTGVAESERGGTAKQLLGAAATFCYASALTGSLDARGAEYTDVSISSELFMGPNENGQGRVKKIVITARVTMPEGQSDIYERVEKIMRPGCLVTGSLHEGVHMEYDLKPIYQG